MARHRYKCVLWDQKWKSYEVEHTLGFPPSIISVPLPAILVDIVIAYLQPACAMISASLAAYYRVRKREQHSKWSWSISFYYNNVKKEDIQYLWSCVENIMRNISFLQNIGQVFRILNTALSNHFSSIILEMRKIKSQFAAHNIFW